MEKSDLFWSELVKACNITALFSSVIILCCLRMITSPTHFFSSFYSKNKTQSSLQIIYIAQCPHLIALFLNIPAICAHIVFYGHCELLSRIFCLICGLKFDIISGKLNCLKKTFLIVFTFISFYINSNIYNKLHLTQ